ncbi:MAG: zf-HC2 domain-containing protein [Gemmatimonadaceae bacterium]
MSDCSNVEMREWLPELLHDRLEGNVRSRVEAHVVGCADCTAELEVLRAARAVWQARSVPRMDVRAIAAALPRPRAARAAPARASRSVWRIAAAVTFVGLGGVSLAVVRQYFGEPAVVTDTTGVARPAPSGREPATARPDSLLAGIPVSLTAGGGVADLADEDIEALIGALDRLEAVPHAEPDTATFGRIVSGATGGN